MRVTRSVAAVSVAAVAVFAGSITADAVWSQEKQEGSKSAANPDDFAKVHAQWTAVVKDLRKTQVAFRVAADKDRPALRSEFKEKSAQARSLLPRLGAAAEAAFRANPDDATLRAFLPKLAETISFNDDYELALRLCQLVIKHSTEKTPAPVAAYGLGAMAAVEVRPPQFELAQQYLSEAAKLSSRESPQIKLLRETLIKEKEYWVTEAALRKAEEEADSDPAKALPRVLLKTNQGDIVLELFENEAPNTVANFIYLVEKGFYDKLAFTRVLQQFVILGGDPKEDGTGDPGYRIASECYAMKDGKPVFRRHFRGSLSMYARERDTAGSQFLLCLATGDSVRNLDAKVRSDGKETGHTVFGRVVTGFDTMGKLQRRNPQSQADDQETPPDRIERATVIRRRNHPYAPKKIGDPEAKRPEKKSEEKTEKVPSKGAPLKTDAKTAPKASEKTTTDPKKPTDKS